ncbi:MAG TPA: uL15 family ribosomal protein [Candidatus Paceibacterota bacterium]|nr:uL15 family ribosomal protein [Candidatus Paceibacterota bacterium]
MQIHDIKPNVPKKGIKRIGRGGKRGTYSGRGQKGQTSRAGRNVRPGLRDVIIRTPKLRGFKNKPKSKTITLTLTDLNKIKEQRIDRIVLEKNKMISKGQRVKVVATGVIKSAKEMAGVAISKSAASAIVKAGGSVVSK